MCEELHQLYREKYGISEMDWALFSAKLLRQNFDRKELVLAAGKREGYLSYVEAGILRLYLPLGEKELTLGFVFAGDFISVYDSFLEQKPSLFSVEVVRAAKLWRISYADLQLIYAQTEIGNLIGRKMAEELFLLKQKREIALLTRTAEQRYLDLFEQRPELIRQIPLKYIASYIGVSPQALSRIRKRISL
ncbi:Crp/Fnr family transcriptional regulator [Saprospira grandis]|uniref:Transcriptional regulator, Crp/Fnr family n=1 Tax=Saprospira grandis (strain Lewin) TaxID=984262 RepID=H6KZ01_SAPGL|nr:Crp/Fnr family transcriptional regulator [Saprospira grandis]AFC23285.1 putative transcriptional regulator, Crp/Fnr family [Saprospira grandis str. Lewin]